MSFQFPQYMQDRTQPMRQELIDAGFEEILTPEQASEKLDQLKGTALIVVNSVCGCAAGQCRPGVRLALTHAKVPQQLYTVFAGQEREATEKVREYLLPNPPSSPSIALLKDGKLVHFIEREDIEGRTREEIAQELTDAFDQYC